MVVSLFQACPLPLGSCFPLTLQGWPGASSVGRRGLDGNLHLCSAFLLCWGHKLSPHSAVAGWDSSTRVTALCMPFTRWEPACGPVTSVACSLFQRCPAPGEAEKTTGLQATVPSNLGGASPLTAWKGRREGAREGRREEVAHGFPPYYKCPISQLQGQLRATVAASVMCPVLLGTKCSAAATSADDQSP